MIKKGLKVRVLTGKDKKKEGEVIEIDRANNRAKVKEINMVKKHVKTTKEKKGGIFSKEGFIHLSNLKLIDEKAEKKKDQGTWGWNCNQGERRKESQRSAQKSIQLHVLKRFVKLYIKWIVPIVSIHKVQSGKKFPHANNDNSAVF